MRHSKHEVLGGTIRVSNRAGKHTPEEFMRLRQDPRRPTLGSVRIGIIENPQKEIQVSSCAQRKLRRQRDDWSSLSIQIVAI
jgi:hypothetical protein